MTDEKIVITEFGINIIKDKIDKLKQEAKEVLEELKEVRDNSLSSEDNTEVHQYTQRYEGLQDQINEHNKILNNCRVIDVSNIATDKVRFGSVVTLLDVDTDEEKVYRIVSTFESDPSNGLISYTSPLGEAILGLGVDDSFEIGHGEYHKEYEILNIESKPMT